MKVLCDFMNVVWNVRVLENVPWHFHGMFTVSWDLYGIVLEVDGIRSDAT